jgi:16S rRNA (guanine527-N7)-methyltransferase
MNEEIRALIAHAATLGVELAELAATRLSRYLDALSIENESINLTAVRDRASGLVLHVLDSVAIGAALFEAPRLALDLGTGNGFPGVAIAALWPNAEVVLCDRTRKKIDAVGRCLVAADIACDAIWADADQLAAQRPELQGAFDLVVARAVGDPVMVARSAQRLLARDGSLALWLTAEDRPPVDLAGGLRREGLYRYELPEPEARSRAIAVYRRTARR